MAGVARGRNRVRCRHADFQRQPLCAGAGCAALVRNDHAFWWIGFDWRMGIAWLRVALGGAPLALENRPWCAAARHPWLTLRSARAMRYSASRAQTTTNATVHTQSHADCA